MTLRQAQSHSEWNRTMNWVTTNIRIPEDVYMELKMEAARKRKSVAQIVRERIAKKSKLQKSSKTRTQALLRGLDEIARKNSKYVPKDKNFSDLLIEMRYEQ